MDVIRKRLRLSSCVMTIFEVHGHLDPGQDDSILLHKFEQLKTALNSVDLDKISENDVQEVEDATNRLLKELGLFYPEAVPKLSSLGSKH
ncbi:MAG: hypothetical protein JRG97_02195 [Deltaproteobacteria bacterium]|nr:hypothetical protein [Deltaproteobacteria bacterium]MBW2051588.1 hypothetical protein [Deltaproteobacteria bacterium]MBW2139868.1 hypothetical protein [Deltaproteobacteria bacterium]MBW2323815.1 hypothetical protein [Deltaproteobacteria bacterium]